MQKEPGRVYCAAKKGSRVGRNYQAVCPKVISLNKAPTSLNDHATLVWAPSDRLSSIELTEYVIRAKMQFSVQEEPALTILRSENYKTQKALARMRDSDKIHKV